MGNSSLLNAGRNVNDEFYTQLSTIEDEIKHYMDYFKGKVVYVNCDDARWSNFYTYFHDNFKKLKLKALISSHYLEQNRNLFNLEEVFDKPLATYYDGYSIEGWWMKGDGDFRSPESVELLLKSDIVVTNPPFSLIRDLVNLIYSKNKDFLIMGTTLMITYKGFDELYLKDKLRPGYTFHKTIQYVVPDNTIRNSSNKDYDEQGNKLVSVPATGWWTTLTEYTKPVDLDLEREYYKDPSYYRKYDNYDAINVGYIKDIPVDYYGYMGVPVTYINRHDNSKFELVGAMTGGNSSHILKKGYAPKDPLIDGEAPFKRLLIRRRRPEEFQEGSARQNDG